VPTVKGGFANADSHARLFNVQAVSLLFVGRRPPRPNRKI